MRTLITLILVLFSVQFNLEAQTLPFTNYTPEREINPLPSAEVHHIYQDKIGYIWFSVYSSGIVRYNGTTMKVYGTDEGLRDLSVWEVLEDTQGRLWVASNAGLVVSEKPLTEYGTGESVRFVMQLDGIDLLGRSVNHNKMALDSRGRLWVGTYNLGIIRYSYDEEGVFSADTTSTDITNNGEESPVRAIASTEDGQVWVSLIEGELIRFSMTGEISRFNTETDTYTNALFVDEKGILWGGDQDGRVWRLDEADNQPVFTTLEFDISGRISDFTEDSRGNIWITSEGDGILKVPATDFGSSVQSERIDQSNGLLSNIVFNTFEDRENNIWIAQSGGVSKLRYNYAAFKNLTAESYGGEKLLLPGSSVGSIHHSDSNQLPCSIYAGTSQGGVACISEDFESESITQEDGLQYNWVNGLETDSAGRIWIGTTRGLTSVSNLNSPAINGVTSSRDLEILGTQAQLSTYNTASILAAENLRIAENSSRSTFEESLWFPGYDEVYVVVNDRFYIMDASFGLPNVIYHSAAFDGDGHLWLGTRDRGIYRSKLPFNLETLQNAESSNETLELFEQWWSTENGAPTNQIEKMLWLDGLMWVGTGSGLYALDSYTLEAEYVITTDDGFLANNATSFDYSHISETLWVGTNVGLAEVDPEKGTVLRNLTKHDGLVDNEVWFFGSVEVGNDGTVYFGTAKGISIYRPNLDYRNEEPPKIVIEKVIFDEGQGGSGQFTFEYSALSFGNERGLRYQTRLLGFNDEWSSLTSETRINYTNLPAVFSSKEFVFEVKAVNESNIYSQETAQYAIHASPPLFLRWWAFLFYAAIFSACIITVYSNQRRKLVKKDKELSQAREIELAYEKLELAHQNLKAAKDQLVQQEKLASLGQLTAGIAHEIKNPLNFVNNFSDVSTEMVEELVEAMERGDLKDAEELAKMITNNLKIIHDHGTRADSIVKSMLQHSRGGDGSMEPTRLNPLVKEYINLAYHGMRAGKDPIDVEIDLQLDEDVGEVQLVAEDFSRVILNLINNAFDAMREKQGSGYKAQRTGDYQPKLTVRTFQKDQSVVIEIEDNGPGIPDEMKDKIMQPFFTTKKGTQGTGLGLSITNDIVKAHGGDIHIESVEDRYTIFKITIPIVNPKD